MMTQISPEHCMALLNLSNSMLGHIKREELMKCAGVADCRVSHLQTTRAYVLHSDSTSDSTGQSDSLVEDDWLEVSGEDVWPTDKEETMQFMAQSKELEENEGK